MSRKVFIILVSLVFLYTLGICPAWADQQLPPLMPSFIMYGTAYVDGIPLDRTRTDCTVSVSIERFLVIFLDNWESQGLIGNIISELNAGAVGSLQQAFVEAGISLSPNSTVAQMPGNEWQVSDPDARKTYTVMTQGIDVWNPPNWQLGNKMEVYEHDGLIAFYTMGHVPTIDEYMLEIPMGSDQVLAGNPPNTYVLREPRVVIPGDRAYIRINGINITQPALPYEMDQEAFVEMDIYAPSTHEFTMNLEADWNLMSFPINKCFYQGNPPTDIPACIELVNISSLGFSYMKDWFTSILAPNNPVDDVWLVVTRPGAAMDIESNPSFHTLKYMSPHLGYKVKINEDAGGATLSLNGAFFDPGCAIHLQQDWNFIGYPLMVCYYDTDSPPIVDVPEGTTWVKVDAPVAEHVFGSIAGKYLIITGQHGRAYDPAHPSFSTLHYIAPGDAFLIKMYEEADLIYE